jgi:hypothetical protein
VSDPKAVSLHIRPFQVSHLCFAGGGIIEISLALLGAPVKAFDFPGFYAILGGVPTVSGDPSRLRYNFLDIEAAVASFALVSLRSEPRKAALNSAINARQNAYFAKYANAAAIIAQMNTFYSPSIVGSKPQRLAVLSGIATNQWNALKAAYTSAGRTGVVTNTFSQLCSDTTSYGYSATSGVNDAYLVAVPDVPTALPSPAPNDPPAPWAVPQGWPAGCQESDRNRYGAGTGEFSSAPPPQPPQPAGNTWGEGSTGPNNTTATIQKGSSYQTVSSGDKAYQTQTIVNTDYGYRAPYFEGAAQFERAQISLIDQQFSQFMYGQNLSNLARIFQNELNSIDGNVFRMQVALLDTILLSPINGTITGIYKNPGDSVRAGEAVVRVEDNTFIYLVATIIHRGPVVVCPPPPAVPPPNSTVTVTTSLFDASGPLTPLTGSVVSARGHRDDDKWDLIVKCKNPLDMSGNPIFPLGYNFDYDNTTVAIS